MTGTTTRREFLRRSSGTAAAWAAAAWAGGQAAAGESKPALCVGCRDAHLNLPGADDCWAAMKAIGAEGVEAAVNDELALTGLFHPQVKYTAADAAGIERLRADTKAAGRRIAALCMHNRFDARPEFELEWCTKAAKAAKALGVPAIRIDLAPRKVPAGEFLEFAVKTLGKLIEATEETGVAFGIENHGATTNNPEFLKPLLERVPSKRLGLTLDTGNFYWFGHPLSKLYELYAAFAPRAVHTHCKSIKYPEEQREQKRPMGWEYGKYNCPIYEGDIDFRRVVELLRKAGYTGDLCVEDESLGRFPAEQRKEVLAREIALLKGL